MPTLTADQLGHHYGSLLLFRKLSFTLTGGDSMAVTGANGAGKSTLLRILAGVLSPKAGRVRLSVRQSEISAERHPRCVGLVAPALGLYESLTARENLEFLAQARRLADGNRRIEAVLERVSLTDRSDDQVGTFSSGMRQRVKYAAALLSEPPLLLLDEPSATLDEDGREMVEDIIDEQRTENGLVVVATNRADEVDRHDHALRIEDHR